MTVFYDELDDMEQEVNDFEAEPDFEEANNFEHECFALVEDE